MQAHSLGFVIADLPTIVCCLLQDAAADKMGEKESTPQTGEESPTARSLEDMKDQATAKSLDEAGVSGKKFKKMRAGLERSQTVDPSALSTTYLILLRRQLAS